MTDPLDGFRGPESDINDLGAEERIASRFQQALDNTLSTEAAAMDINVLARKYIFLSDIVFQFCNGMSDADESRKVGKMQVAWLQQRIEDFVNHVMTTGSLYSDEAKVKYRKALGAYELLQEMATMVEQGREVNRHLGAQS